MKKKKFFNLSGKARQVYFFIEKEAQHDVL